MKKLFFFLSILTMSALIILPLRNRSFAQLDTESITITPPSIKVTVNPGDKQEGTLGLINDSDADLSFVVATYDFIVTDTHGTPQLLPYGTIANNKYSAANWIAAAPTGFTVKAHMRYTLNYYLQIPKDAAPGGHYAAIVYQPVSANAQQGSGAQIQTQIATLAYITVNGPVNEFAKVTSFHAPSFQEYGPIQITSELRNYGDVHISPQGSITVKDIFGRVVATSQLQVRNIFPGNVGLSYTNTIGSKFMIGRFTATFLGSYGIHNNLPLTAAVTFWVFPWRIALVLLLLLIAILLGILVWKKKKNTPAPSTPATSNPMTTNENKQQAL